VLWGGVPALRHDWSWPRSRPDFLAAFVESTSGWSPIGFGAQSANPSGYLVAPLVDLVGLIAGPYGALWIYLSIVGATCAMGGWALARAVAGREGMLAAVAAATIATFNPWVYNKIVAAHTYMLLAYAALALLLALLIAGRDATSFRAALLAVVAYVQLQFFLIFVAVLAVAAVRRRRWLALATACVIALPTAFGIVGEFGALSRTPITVPWEVNQSVPPLQAAELVGYFAHYATQFDGIGAAPALVLGLLALAGAIAGSRLRYVPFVTVATLGTIVAALGAYGPFAGPFLHLVQQTPLVGIYRELYDLLGLAAIGYIALALVAVRRVRVLGFVLAGVAATFVGLWCANPPARYFVDARTLPTVVLSGPPSERFALIPAFQPLQFDGRGSGPDPDAGLRSDGRSSINEYVPSYPVDAALAAYQQFGDTKQLAALGVKEIVDRPGFTTDAPALRAQLGTRDPFRSFGGSRILHDDVAPLVGLEQYPSAPSLVPRLGDGAVFFSDAPGGGAILVPQASNASLDAQIAWVDARLQTIAHPEYASALGGAYTENRAATLPVESGERFALAAVAGRLMTSDARELAHTAQPAYAWTKLPPGTTALRCDGRCAVAAFARQLPVDTGDAAASERPLEAVTLTPWLIAVDVTVTGTALLRLNERYDPAWRAFSGTARLPHVRVDATSNGWVIAPGTNGRVLMIDTVAGAQACAEIVGAIWTIALIAVSWRRRLASPA
jgi:hypothetical protein